MKASDEELRRLFARATARPQGRADACPSAEALRAAVDGPISPAERDSLVDHLAACSNCAAEHRVLADVRAWAESVGRAAEVRIPAATEGAPRLTAPGQRSRGFRMASWPQGMAASLAAISLTLGVWAASLHRENQQLSASAQAGEVARAAEAARAQAAEAALSRLRSVPADAQPLLNVAIVDLFPPSPERGVPGSSTAVVDAPVGAGLVTFILNPRRRPVPGEYRLTLLDARGTVLWQGEGLRPSAESNFTIAVPNRLLTAGEYRIRVSGARERGVDVGVIEEYSLRVR